MVKFFGVIFLGQPREHKPRAGRTTPARWERAGMVWLALGCVALGLLPIQFIQLIDPVTRQLVGDRPRADAWPRSGWLLVPDDHRARELRPGDLPARRWRRASRWPSLLVRRLYHGRLRRAAPWDCGFPWQTARMQDTAEGFGQPIRQIFEPFFRMQRELPSPFDARAALPGRRRGPLLALALPARSPTCGVRVSRLIGLLQQGRIAVYLLYSFLTLVALLLVVRR